MECQCDEVSEKYVRGEGIQELDTPTKSQNDKKSYRVIKLKNGLIATLISDPRVDDEDGKTRKESESSASATDGDDDTDENMEVDDADDSDDGDDEETEKMAACRLVINVGSLSDPKEIPGLAHFLEHMVFMGSEKYPEENDFSQFTENKGGESNAETHEEKTVFYFEIQEKHLLPAMDRFAQFFISPLLKRDAISREREAVDSEFKMARQSDSSRKDQVFMSLAGKDNPLNKFFWGNCKTLKDDVEEDKLYTELQEFRKRHYSAHRMNVAVQARLTLDELEKAVVECFSNIPNNSLPPEDFSIFKDVSFNNPDYTKIYKIKAIKDKCNLELTWILPTMHDLYRQKPWKYYAQVLDSDKKGSLNHYLRQKLWIHTRDYTGWSSYQSDSTCGYNSIYALFRISLDLTDEGREHIKDVLDAVFSYLNMLRSIEPPTSFLDEIKLLKELDFRFIDENQPYENVELAENMIQFPPLDFITGENFFFEYNVPSIKEYINYLSPDKVNIIITDKKLNEDELKEFEPWFETKYSSELIPNEWVTKWKSIQPYPEFHLPQPNMFVPDDFSLVELPKNVSEHPEKVYHDDKIEIWHKISQKFRVPKAYLSLELISPLTEGSVERRTMRDVLLTALKLLSIEENMDAEDAGLGFVFYTSRFGLVIATYGFNHKLPLLLNVLLKHVADCHKVMTKEVFQLVKEKQLKAYYQRFIKPDNLSTDLNSLLRTDEFYFPTDKHAALQTINYDQFLEYTKQFTESMYVKCMAEGNITKETLIKSISESLEPLQYKPIVPDQYPSRKVWEILEGITYGQVKNLNPKDDNTTVTNFYECGVFSINLKMLTELLMEIMQEPVFNQLRTIDHLGYDVSCSSVNTYELLGFNIKVCTQATKFTAEQVEEKIDSFLKTFISGLKNMSQEQFEEHKETLIKTLQLPNLSLAEEFYEDWHEIERATYVFDRKQQNVSMLNNLTLADFHKFIDAHIINESTIKRLNLRVLGTANSENEIKSEESENDSKTTKYSVTVLPIENLNDKTSINIHCIKDVAEYKKNLKTSYSITPRK